MRILLDPVCTLCRLGVRQRPWPWYHWINALTVHHICSGQAVDRCSMATSDVDNSSRMGESGGWWPCTLRERFTCLGSSPGLQSRCILKVGQVLRWAGNGMFGSGGHRYRNYPSASSAKCQQARSRSDGLHGRTGGSFCGEVSGYFDGVIAVLASRINCIQWLAVCPLTSGSARLKQTCFVLDS